LNSQGQFDFEAPAPDGLDQWRQRRELASRGLAERLGLPLDHEVHVRLKNSMELSGRLELKESVLFLETVDETSLELRVGRADFTLAEMESCVRAD
jgi:predicted membrane GTPase involved in stress response